MEKEIKEKIKYMEDVRDVCCFTCYYRHKVAACCFCEKHEITIKLLGKCIDWRKRK